MASALRFPKRKPKKRKTTSRQAMNSHNGGSPSKARASVQATTETSEMHTAAVFESRRIPCLSTRRPFMSEAPPMASASTPK